MPTVSGLSSSIVPTRSDPEAQPDLIMKVYFLFFSQPVEEGMAEMEG